MSVMPGIGRLCWTNKYPYKIQELKSQLDKSNARFKEVLYTLHHIREDISGVFLETLYSVLVGFYICLLYGVCIAFDICFF